MARLRPNQRDDTCALHALNDAAYFRHLATLRGLHNALNIIRSFLRSRYRRTESLIPSTAEYLPNEKHLLFPRASENNKF